MMKHIIQGLFIGICLMTGGKTFAQDAQLDRGNELYQYWCVPCHGAGPRNPGTQALEFLYKGAKPAVLEERTDLLPEYTKLIVRKGVSVMPFFRKTEISDSDLDAIAVYLAQ